MINIRLSGTPEEIHHAVKKLERVFIVVKRSKFYPNRNKKKLYAYIWT